jgi:hypothetical protein
LCWEKQEGLPAGADDQLKTSISQALLVSSSGGGAADAPHLWPSHSDDSSEPSNEPNGLPLSRKAGKRKMASDGGGRERAKR